MEELDTADGESVEALRKFTNWVEAFCKENNIIEYKDREEYEPIINMTNGELLSLSSDECFANALTLMNYAGILQKKHDLIDSQYNWCIEALNFLCISAHLLSHSFGSKNCFKTRKGISVRGITISSTRFVI